MLSPVDLFESYGVGNEKVEEPLVLNRAEKATDHEADERRLQGYAHVICFSVSSSQRRNKKRPCCFALQTAERPQRREDQDQKSDESGHAKLGGNFKIRVMSETFANRIRVIIAHADA